MNNAIYMQRFAQPLTFWRTRQYIHTYNTHTYTHTYIHRTYIHTYIYANIHIYIQICVYVEIHITYLPTEIHTYQHTYIYMYIQNLPTPTPKYLYTTRTQRINTDIIHQYINSLEISSSWFPNICPNKNIYQAKLSLSQPLVHT